MGSASSSRKRRIVNYSCEVQKNQKDNDTKSVEKFTREAFAGGGNQALDCMQSILSTPSSKSTFVNYLMVEYDNEEERVEGFVQELEDCMELKSAYDPRSSKGNEEKDNDDDYAMNRRSSDDRRHRPRPEDAKTRADKSRIDMVSVKALNTFGGFLTSSTYAAWRAAERAAVSAKAASGFGMDGVSPDDPLLFKQRWLADKAFATLDRSEMMLLVGGSMWMLHLMAAAESLPIPLALITRTPVSAKGQHVVYVNPAFERMTSFSRSELLRRGLGRILCDEPEFAVNHQKLLSPNYLRRSLETVEVSCERKNRTTYISNVTLKQVFDEMGNTRYVIALMCTTEGERDSSHAVRLEVAHHEELLAILPSETVKSDDEVTQRNSII